RLAVRLQPSPQFFARQFQQSTHGISFATKNHATFILKSEDLKTKGAPIAENRRPLFVCTEPSCPMHEQRLQRQDSQRLPIDALLTLKEFLMKGSTRRQFLKQTTLTGIGFWVGGGNPAQSRSPNEKLNLGIIGVGGRGAANLASVASENIVALCDVDE